jgi:cytochrome o ubiquinol oxidase subunit 2
MFVLAAAGVIALLVSGNSVPVLEPKGFIADKERDLIIMATLLSLIVVLPVFVLTALIAWKYRAGNKKAKYKPERDGSRLLESIWWGVPLVLIIILSVIIYRSSHQLDPFQPIQSEVKPLTIQVIALQWKWLFIYPEQQIATVNFVQFPEDRPVNFDITADAPMNSFWIPSLGGQVYAMSGMSTSLHLMADNPGDYRGSSANISGKGFADMNFTARVSTESEFDLWVESVKMRAQTLNMNEYHRLAKPDSVAEPIYYGESEPGLYRTILEDYMKPGDHSDHGMEH